MRIEAGWSKKGIAGFFLLLGLWGCGHPEANGSRELHYVRDPSFPSPSLPFSHLSGIEIDVEEKLLYLAQRSRPPVLVLGLDGTPVRRWKTEEIGKPHSIRLHKERDGSRSVWITDMAPPRPAGTGFGHCLKKFTKLGFPLGHLGECGEKTQGSGLSPVQFDQVTDAAWDAAGRMYVTDGDQGLNHRVLELDAKGVVQQVWSAPGNQPGEGPKEFTLPHGVVIDPCKRVWIADTLNRHVQAITTDGRYLGTKKCFGGEKVYGIALGSRDLRPSPPRIRLFITTSPEEGGKGSVHVFDVPMDCRKPGEIGGCDRVARWDVRLGSPKSSLHGIAVDPATGDVYLAPAGEDLPPQKWTLLP